MQTTDATMIAMEDPDVLAELAAAARVYARTKKAHDAAAKTARDLVLASLQAGHSVPKVAKEAPFTYAYVRDIAEDNGIPRDQRKARYKKADIGTAPAPAIPASTERAPEADVQGLVEVVAGLGKEQVKRAIKHLRAVRKDWFGETWKTTDNLSGEVRERRMVTMAVEAKLLAAKDLSAF
jgi:hypothetical protein